MKFKNKFKFGALASVLLLSASCADDFKEININPSNVSETIPEGMMMAAITQFQPTDYLVWFYNVNYFTRWSQMATPGSGFTDDYTGHNETGGQGSQYINTLKYRNVLKNHIAETNTPENNGYYAATGILTVYLGIFDSDIVGSIPYTEACHYDDLGIVTPKYDTMEELYTIWIDELNEYIGLLQSSGLNSIPRQDPAYGGDWSKWARLANSLKLKIAVRLYNNDPTKAMAIANEAATNSAGLITDIADDFLFAKATKAANSDRLDDVYGTGNGLSTQYATTNVLNFLLDSKDPRVRFIYEKNGFNSLVVQSFIDNGKAEDLPSQVKENVEFDADGNFKAWKGMGEPWVRYTGLPIQYDPKSSHDSGTLSNEEYEEYWNSGTRYQIKLGDYAASYNPFCYFTHELRRGRVDFTLPTVVESTGDGEYTRKVIQDTDDNPLYQLYIGAGEVNLYMAELALLNGGSFGGKTAEAWYEAGVKASVQEYDKLASLNKIPYYGTTYNYDPNEVSIELKDGEIEAMLATSNVQLTGSTSEKLEKVYLQQLIHFSEQCSDQFVTARRSGYPKVGSTLLPYVKFDQVALSAIPRRFAINEPTVTDLMYDIKKAAYQQQGFTQFGSVSYGSQFNGGNAPLNVERVWADKNAPQWGTPNN